MKIMKKLKYFLQFTLGLFFCLSLSFCKNKEQSLPTAIDNINPIDNTTVSTGSPYNGINYELSVEEVLQNSTRPALESFAMGRSGNKILLIGGRKSGFHGRADPTEVFSTKQANDSLWVIDLDSGDAWGAPIPPEYSIPFSATNYPYCQSGDTLFIAGGYGLKAPNDTQANFTIDQITGIKISGMIDEITNGGSADDLKNQVLFTIQDTLVQVAGGVLDKIGTTFYLVMGQNYSGTYVPGNTGIYTEAIRTFQIQNSNGDYSLTNTNIIKDTQTPTRLHRRDLNVVQAIRNDKQALTVFGGVFTNDGSGWLNPVFLDMTTGGNVLITSDTFQQKMNNYHCATIPIYDGLTDAMFTSFLGGISYEQYVPSSQQFVVGDNGIPLPFINTISTLAVVPGKAIDQKIQIPPNDPVLPSYIGAEAVFIPDEAFVLNGKVLDFQKINSTQRTKIGVMYGGIRATAPSSSSMNPTFASNSIFNVYFNPTGLNEN